MIRTAVFGSPDSDEPALCPETPDELDAFRLEHADATIWCGTMFEGGCGRRLTTRRCTDKICHFAHIGTSDGASRCARTERGKDSADHLFAKAHLASWLRTQELSAEFSYPDPLGSAVLARLGDGRSILVHLDRSRPVTFDPQMFETILGPGVRVSAHVLAERGYVHRVRFADREGGGRAMQFGTEVPVKGTVWQNTRDVVLTEEGLLTTARPTVAVTAPAPPRQRAASSPQRTVVTVRSSGSGARPAAADSAPQVLLRFDKALREDPARVVPAMEDIRRMLARDPDSLDAPRLHIALRRGQAWQQQWAQEREQVLELLQRLPSRDLLGRAQQLLRYADATDEERSIVADCRSRLRAAEQQERAERERQEAARRIAEQAERQQRLDADQRARERAEEERAALALELARMQEERERQAVQAAQQALVDARAATARRFAPAVRGALRKAAREQRPTSWQDIQTRTGMRQLAGLDQQERLEVLVLVERGTAAEDPLWSTLLAADGEDRSVRLYRLLAQRLGRELPDDDATLIDILEADREVLHRTL
ncbi:competence protein CoiA family protein [Streptomyces sp. SGAir0957]